MARKAAYPITASLQAVPSGESGTRAVLGHMRRYVLEGKKSLPVRTTAVSIVENLPEKNRAAEIKAVHEWVRDNIRYVRDVRDVETLTRPQELLEIASGDCDDKATLLAALLESIGFKTRFVAMGQMPRRWSHVIVEAKYKDKWIPLETTEPVKAGWYPPGFWYRLEMPI